MTYGSSFPEEDCRYHEDKKIKDILFTNVDNISQEYYKRNPNVFSILLNIYKESDKYHQSIIQDVRPMIILMEDIWIKSQYPAINTSIPFIDNYVFYDGNKDETIFSIFKENPQFFLYPFLKEEERLECKIIIMYYKGYKKINKWLNKIFRTTHSELQLSIACSAMDLSYFEELHDSLCTNTIFCEKNYGKSVQEIIDNSLMNYIEIIRYNSNCNFILSWLRRSVENKNIRAATILGFLYYCSDKKCEARLWLRIAAETDQLSNEAARYLLTKMSN